MFANVRFDKIVTLFGCIAKLYNSFYNLSLGVAQVWKGEMGAAIPSSVHAIYLDIIMCFLCHVLRIYKRPLFFLRTRRCLY